MPVTNDIRRNLRYQQGVVQRKAEDKNKIAEQLLKEGMHILCVHEATDLPLDRLRKMERNKQ